MSITSVVNDLVTSVSVINALKPLPPTISGYSVGGLDDTALDPAGGQTVQINGTGFLAGATITFDGSAVAVVTYVNPNRLTFTSPAKSAGTYTIYAVNPDGGTAIFIPGIIYSVLPTWTTAAGSLGSYYETTSISNTVVASGDAPITYSLFSGSLPTGSTLYANGVITGTAPVDSSSTTYSFTIQATDAQLQDSTRSFSLTINVDAVTWVSPANATTYTSAVNSAISNVALSATDAAGYNVSYSANALPTGLSLSGSNISGTPTVIADSSTLLTATAATTNRTATRTINWSITVANDTYFEYNTLLIPGASTTFVDDASTNNFAVSIFGDTKPNSFNPYTPGYYSNYFNGSTSSLNIGSTVPATLVFGTSDFTVECWVNFASIPAGTCLMGNLNAGSTVFGVWSIYFYGSPTYKISFFCNAPAVGYDFAYTITPNQWVHLAICRASGSIRAFINGVQIGSTQASSVNITNSGEQAGGFYIGRANDGVGYFPGYLSNIRILKGTGLYTAAFTPPTSPLTAIANTSLLTSQSNRFIDNSTNTYTLTAGTSTQASSFQPFTPNTSYSTYGSGYFDGTGDYLTVPGNSVFAFGTGDFTLEVWLYANSISTGTFDRICATSDYNGSGFDWTLNTSTSSLYVVGTAYSIGSITPKVWHHLVYTRSGSVIRGFLNGNLSSYTTGASQNVSSVSQLNIGTGYSGTALNGYLVDLRIIKGSIPAGYQTSSTTTGTQIFTPPSAPLTAIANTSLLVLQNNQSVNNSVFLDNSSNNFLVTRAGNTTQGTFSPYGGNWSNYFNNGQSNYIQTTIQAMTAAFTVECWVYVTSLPNNGVIIGQTWELWINTNGTVSYYTPASVRITTSLTVSLNTWTHIALVRSSGIAKIYINGVADAATYTNSGTVGSLETTYIGRDPGASGGYNGYISNLRIVNGTAVYTSTFTPSTTPLTAIANTSLLTCQSQSFVDNSPNRYAVTISGTPTVQRFSPFNPSSLTPTSYSGYFDGTGDYISVPDNVTFTMGAGDFTIECWVNLSTISGSQIVIGTCDSGGSQGSMSFVLNVNSGTPKIGVGYAGAMYFATAASAISTNTWVHLAGVRNGASVYIYVNGVQSTALNMGSLAITDSTQIVAIGRNGAYNGEYVTGYISNARIVKGTAVYTSAFTPPTSPLTAISGTSLLTCQSPTFIDNSTNNFTISAFGNSQPTQQNPFGFTSATTNGYTVSTIGGSGYFDGTGDYLTAPTNNVFSLSAAFTFETWLYPTAFSSYKGIWSNTNTINSTGLHVGLNSAGNIFIYSNSSFVVTSSNAMTLNAWNHVAVVRNSGIVYIYINGVVSTNSWTTSTAFTNAACVIGTNPGPGVEYYFGYLSDARLLNGTALYTSNFVPPSAPLTAVQNTSILTNMTSAGIYDAAMMNNMETVGDAKLSTAISKFGGSSMFFDGTGDYLTSNAATTDLYAFGSGDFTIEMWLYLNSVSGTQVFYDQRPLAGGVYPTLYMSGSTLYYYTNSANRITGSTLSTSQWYHIAVSRSSTSTKLFVNGIQSGSTYTDTNVYLNAALRPFIGGDGTNLGTNGLNGYIDDLRVTKGYARYTSNFTAPTSAFPIY